MKYSKWRMLLTALCMAAVLAGCGSETGGDTHASAPGDASQGSSAASGTDSGSTETPDSEMPLDQENNVDSDIKEESKIGEYTLWSGIYTLYGGDQVHSGILEEVGYDASGEMIFEGYSYGLTYALSNSSWDDYVRSQWNGYDVFIPNWIKYDYDEYGNVTKSTVLSSHDIMNDDDVTEWREYENEYDAQGNLIKKTRIRTWSEWGGYSESPKGLDEYYEYDASGNLTRESYGGWEYEYEYDASGNLIRRTDVTEGRANSSWLFEYDVSGNLTRYRLGYGSGEFIKTKEYEYDASGHPIRATLPQSYSDADGEEYEYDASGNLTKIKSVSGESGAVSSWIEFEYAASDTRPPEIDPLVTLYYSSWEDNVMLEKNVLQDNPAKITWYDFRQDNVVLKKNVLQNNPIKITWYDSQGNIEKTWEWIYQIINE